QTLMTPVASAELQWVGAGVTQRVAGGQLTLAFAVSAGETVVASKPQSLPDGTLFVFSSVAPPAAAPTPVSNVASPAPSVTTSVAGPASTPPSGVVGSSA